MNMQPVDAIFSDSVHLNLCMYYGIYEYVIFEVI